MDGYNDDTNLVSTWNTTTIAPPGCDNNTASSTSCILFRNIFYLGIIGSISILGFAGNSLSIVILQKDTGTTVATFLLQALAIADNSLLLGSFFVLSISYGSGYSDTFVNYTVKYIQPLGYMSETATIWTTVLLALNRYVAICRPFQVSRFSTISKARVQVFVVFGFSISFNLVRFFQVEVHASVINGTEVTCRKANILLGDNSLFGVIYTNALYTVLCVVLPLIVLIILNTSLITEIKKIKIRRASLASRSSRYGEDNITIIMVTIIILVLVCHVPDRLLQIVTAIYYYQAKCGKVMFYMYALTNLLVILNSSTNFIIYYVFRASFRVILKQKLCCPPDMHNAPYKLNLTLADVRQGQEN